MEKKTDLKLVQGRQSTMSDEDIVALYFARNEKAISETDLKYGRYLFTIAYNIVHDRLDCEECLNDTYLGTWNAIPPHRPPVFQVFLSKIMRNTAVDKFRKTRASKRIPSELVVSLDELNGCMPSDISEEERVVAEIGGALNSFLKGLNDREQFIFVCRYYYADKIGVIARMLQISEKTVGRELVRLRELLREHLKKEGVAYE